MDDPLEQPSAPPALAVLPVLAAAALGLLALAASAVLLVLDFTTGFLTSGAHSVVSATPLALVALAYLAHQLSRRRTRLEFLKVVLLAAAFLLWSAYQLFPNLPRAAVFNDLAIGLFVLDVALVVAARPSNNDWA